MGAASTPKVDAVVGLQPEQPCGQAGIGLKAAKPAPRAQEGLLRHVGGILRIAGHAQREPVDGGLDADGEEYTLDAPDPAKLPEEELLAREEREELRAAMDLLAPEQRLILSLRVENDLSYTDIAAVLGVREGTVKSRLARARDQLRKKLSQSGNKAAAASSNPQKGGRGREL